MHPYFVQLADFNGDIPFGFDSMSFEELHTIAKSQTNNQEARKIAAIMANRFGLPGLVVYFLELKREAIENKEYGDGYVRIAEKAMSYLKFIQYLYESEYHHFLNGNNLSTLMPDIDNAIKSDPLFWITEHNDISKLAEFDIQSEKRIQFCFNKFVRVFSPDTTFSVRTTNL